MEQKIMYNHEQSSNWFWWFWAGLGLAWCVSFLFYDDEPHNITWAEGKEYLISQGYEVKSYDKDGKYGKQIICKHSKVYGDVWGYTYEISKNSIVKHVVVCNNKVRVSGWDEDKDPLHLAQQKHLYTQNGYILTDIE
jgi:hypothetical protein